MGNAVGNALGGGEEEPRQQVKPLANINPLVTTPEDQSRMTPQGEPAGAPLSPPVPIPGGRNASGGNPSGMFSTDWCCGGENRVAKGKKGAPKKGLLTLADCDTARAGEERRLQELNQQLILASTTGNVQRIRTLLSLHADINFTKGDKTSLHLAAHSGQVEVVQVLVFADADCNFQDQEQRSPLHVACLNGNAEMCQVLIEEGNAKPNLQDKAHMLPLHFACVGGHYEIVEVLLKAGAMVEVPEPKVQPLHFASLGGHCRIAALLLDFNADVDRQTKRDLESPLHLAASRGRNGTVALLLWRKAAVDMRNVHKCTPMHLAARRNHLDTVRLLLNAKGDPTAKQRNDWNPMLIAFKEGNLELGRFLQKLAMERGDLDLDQGTPNIVVESGSAPEVKVTADSATPRKDITANGHANGHGTNGYTNGHTNGAVASAH